VTFEITNSVVGIVWGVVVFLLGGMAISNRRSNK
jgi:hypothetical protein